MRRLTRKVDSGAALFQPVVEALDATLVALDHTSEAIEALKREMAFDPVELEQVESRLFAVRAAARKHQVIPDDLATVLARYRADLEMLENGTTALASLEAAAATTQRFVASQGNLGDEVTTSLHQLSDAAAALERLSDALTRNPSSLIVGKKKPGQP